MGYFPCSFSRNAGILTIVGRTGPLHLWLEKPNQRQTEDVICSSGSDGEGHGVQVKASLPRRSDLGNISSWLAENCFSRAFRICDTGVSCLVAQWRIKLLMLVCQVLLQLNVLQLSLPRLLPKDFC